MAKPKAQLDPADQAAVESTEPKGQFMPIECKVLLIEVSCCTAKCQSHRLEERWLVNREMCKEKKLTRQT
jgi:hypothetical protein